MNLAKLRELWDSGIPVRDIAAQLNTNISTVYELRVMHQLTPTSLAFALPRGSPRHSR